MIRILAYRFSAMGDVALVAPAIKSVLDAHPNVEIVMVTRPLFVPFFNKHERLTVIPVNLKNYEGFFGLRKLYKKLKKECNIDVVCDLHDVLRTNILNTFFKFGGVKVVKIDKGRAEKKKLIKNRTEKKELKHAVDRYLSVFNSINLPTELVKGPWLFPLSPINDYLKNHTLENKTEKWIGIAPFAQHETKVWGLSKIEELVLSVLSKEVKIFLFGGGQSEIIKLEKLQSKFPELLIPSKELNLDQELHLISKLDQMVCMDSANMHMASLVGTPSISIWGSTHPNLGFKPLGEENIILHSKIECSPCSVFGNKACHRGDHACMTRIDVNMVSSKIIVG